MIDLETRLLRIENMLTEVMQCMKGHHVSPVETKWLTEPDTMRILNLSKRAISDIRRKNLIRVSSATGRNFKYYKADVENYLYDHSEISKRRSSK